MPISRLRLSALAIACALSGCAATVPSAGVDTLDAERRAITARLAEVSAALVAGDPEAAAAVFAPDAVYLANGGSTLRGRAAIVGHYRARLATTVYRSLVITPTEVRRVGDTLYEWGTSFAVVVPRSTPDAQPTRAGGQYLTVWARGSDGRWYIECDAPMARQMSPDEQAGR